MDSNKDEAERCIKIAQNAIGNNQHDKARKFLDKAQRLFPTDQARSRCSKSVSVVWEVFVSDREAVAVKPNQLTLACRLHQLPPSRRWYL